MNRQIFYKKKFTNHSVKSFQISFTPISVEVLLNIPLIINGVVLVEFLSKCARESLIYTRLR